MTNDASFTPLAHSTAPHATRYVMHRDSASRPAFDRLTQLAARVLRVPLSLLSFVEADHVYFKSFVGIPSEYRSMREIALSQSTCQYIIASGQPLLVPDIRTHPIAEASPLLHAIDVLAYAGVPLIASDDSVIGVLCVMDTVTHDWTSDDLATIQDIAAAVMTEIELRREVVEQKRVTETLQVRFSTVVENLGEGLLIADLQDTVLYVNPGMAYLTGYTLEELIGRTAHELLVAPESWPMMQARHGQRIKGMHERYELLLKHKHGSQFCAEVSATPLRNAAGEIVGTLGLITDITERKQLEAQLLQAQKMEGIGQLAGGIAHDFNNLLTIILSSAQLSMDAIAPGSQLHDDLNEIRHAATQASGLTRQLLAFARQQVIEPRIVDLNELILAMDRLLRRVIGADVELVTLPGVPLQRIKVDPGQIEQVIINLVMNARDAMGNGGKLSIETANVTLDEQYAGQHLGTKSGPYVRLMISDTGTGMTASVKEHLFEPFFTTKDPGKGTGLGLATSYGIIQQHGGHIDVWSEIGRGATFAIYLPCSQERLPTPINDEEGRLPRGTETVLLVEDEPLVRLASARILANLGYTVLEAAHGDEALRVAERYSGTPQLLLTDIIMPQMGGVDLALHIRLRYPEIKILFTSGYTNPVALKQDVLGKDTAFLPKPFLPASLARKVREVLDT